MESIRPTRGPVVSRATVLRGLGGVALAPLLGSSLAACSGSDDAGESSATSGSVTFVFYGGAENQKAYNKAFDAFRSKYPDITLKAQGISADTWADFLNTVSTRMAGGQAIDVMQVATEGQQLFADRNLFEPLDAYMERDQDFVDEYYADVPPQLVHWLSSYGSPDDKTYYMPCGYNTMVMYVSSKVFGDGGVETPAPEWTWEDFRAAGHQLKSSTGAFLTSAGSGYFTDVMPWLVTNGASTMNEAWDTATFNSPEAVEALTFVRSLVVDGLVPEPGGTFDSPTQLSQGNLATFGGGRWPTPALQKLDAVEGVSLYRWPNNGTIETAVGWEGWPILKASKNKEAAWTFVKFLCSEEYQEVIIQGEGGTFVPARLSVATGETYLDDAPENTELLSELAETAVALPAPVRSTEFIKLVEEAWLQGITGVKEPEAALNEANEKMQDLLS